MYQNCQELFVNERISGTFRCKHTHSKHNPVRYACRCDDRLQTKTKRFTRLSYTGLVVELEHLKIKTRITNEKFESVKGECEI
jgi:hypothetical protein